MTPTNLTDPSSIAATLTRLNATLAPLQRYADAYGTNGADHFEGQYRLLSLGVEYMTTYTTAQVPQRQTHTPAMWALIKGFSALLGMMWWEPWYCFK